MRPQYYVFPDDERGFAIDDQFYLGSTGLLVKPVIVEGAQSVEVYLADGDEETYYDYFNYTIYKGSGMKTIPAPLDAIPMLMQGGHIIPRRDRPRRSSGLMRWDPFSLVIVLDRKGSAEGTLYLDDGETFDYEMGAYIHRRFIMDGETKVLRSEDLSVPRAGTAKMMKQATAYLKTMEKVRIEKMIIVGAPKEWNQKKTVKVKGGMNEEGTGVKEVEMIYHPGQTGQANWAVVRDPKLSVVSSSWTVDFT